MPAQFTVKAADLKVLLQELKQLEPNLRKEMQTELKKEIKPFADKIKNSVPKQSPLSGFDKNVASSVRYSWGTVLSNVKTPLGKNAKKPGYFPVVSMGFKGRAKSAGLNIMELATQGRSPQGNAMVRALNQRYPVQQGLGRFIIPEAKKSAGQATDLARKVIEKFAAKVNRRIR